MNKYKLSSAGYLLVKFKLGIKPKAQTLWSRLFKSNVYTSVYNINNGEVVLPEIAQNILEETLLSDDYPANSV